MTLTRAMDRLQEMAEFEGLRATLRGSGVGSILWGGFAIWAGYTSMNVNPVNVWLLIIGVGLVLEGLWVRTQCHAGAFVVDGFALLVIGLWNVGVSYANMQAGADGGATKIFLYLGLAQIWWAIGRFRSPGTLSGLTEPASAEVAEAERFVETERVALVTADARTDEAVIVVDLGGEVMRMTRQAMPHSWLM